MYQIQTKNDLTRGVGLVVSVPEQDVDKKALYTLSAGTPNFLLPFTYRSVDGMYEFTYQVGTRSKMAYLSGSRNPDEYAEMWFGLLKPLIDCGDWFMKPFSFVLEYDHIYCDKGGKFIGFVYIPTLPDCSNYNGLQNLARDVAKQNPVTDASIENKIVWALQDFKPQTVLDIVNIYKPASVDSHYPSKPDIAPAQPQFSVQHASQQSPVVAQPLPTAQHAPLQPQTPVVQQSPLPIQQTPLSPNAQPVPSLQTPIQQAPANPSGGVGEIAINIQPNKKATKEKPAKAIKIPKEKPVKEKKGFFDRFKKPQADILLGAGGSQPIIDPAPLPVQPVYDMYPQDAETEFEQVSSDTPKLRYIGAVGHPLFIEVQISEGTVFTIGRHDASVGMQQSNFEFDMKTKSISRRHAAIEKRTDGFSIIDLNSKAGTFVNGQRLSPNAAVKLERGCRVSFGYSGADYMWEE